MAALPAEPLHTTTVRHDEAAQITFSFKEVEARQFAYLRRVIRSGWLKKLRAGKCQTFWCFWEKVNGIILLRFGVMVAWPTRDQIGGATGLERSAVSRAIRAIQRDGIVRRATADEVQLWGTVVKEVLPKEHGRDGVRYVLMPPPEDDSNAYWSGARGAKKNPHARAHRVGRGREKEPPRARFNGPKMEKEIKQIRENKAEAAAANPPGDIDRAGVRTPRSAAAAASDDDQRKAVGLLEAIGIDDATLQVQLLGPRAASGIVSETIRRALTKAAQGQIERRSLRGWVLATLRRQPLPDPLQPLHFAGVPENGQELRAAALVAARERADAGAREEEAALKLVRDEPDVQLRSHIQAIAQSFPEGPVRNLYSKCSLEEIRDPRKAGGLRSMVAKRIAQTRAALEPKG